MKPIVSGHARKVIVDQTGYLKLTAFLKAQTPNGTNSSR